MARCPIHWYPHLSVLSVGDNPGRPFAASDLGRLPLLSAVIKESLRLCTPVPWGATRHVVDEEGVELLGHYLPKVRLTRPQA
jgi:cytochrome P450